MEILQLCRSSVVLISVFLCTASIITTEAAGLKANYDRDDIKIMAYHSKLILQCNSTDPTETDLKLKWSKDGVAIKADEKYDIKEADRKLVVHKTGDSDVGKYTCEATNSKNNVTDNKAEINVIGKPYVKMASELSVVEATTMRLECHVWGYPKPEVKWYIGENNTVLLPSSRVSFEAWNNISNAVVIIKDAVMSDRAPYNCTAVNIASKDGIPASGVTNVRIKDKLAALWPFLGICAEVIVLCTIILIYEKKRNKTELDESDTDQSPEQKNTPDHGKADCRQRK